jgi:hypothetical protein
VATFVNRVNTKLHSQEQEERVRQISERIGPFENVSAPPEITSVCRFLFVFHLDHFLRLFRYFKNIIVIHHLIDWIFFVICHYLFEAIVVRLFNKDR